MENKLVIRVLKGTSENARQQLQNAIIAQLELPIDPNDQSAVSENISFEEYEPYKKHLANDYYKRIESMANAAKFLIEAELLNSPHNSKVITLNNQLAQIIVDYRLHLKQAKQSPAQIYNHYLHNVIALLQNNGFINNATKQEASNWLDRAEEYLLLTKPRPIICSMVNKMVIIDEPLSAIDDIDDFKKVPEHLPPYEKRLYQCAIKKIEEDELNPLSLSLSSRLDSIKGVRNFWREGVYKFNTDNTLTLLTEEHRLSIIGSRSQEQTINEIIASHSFEIALKRAITNFLKKNPNWDPNEAITSLYETLITPLTIKKEDNDLYKLKLKVIKNFQDNGSTINIHGKTYKIDLIEANFSLNLGRHFLPTLPGTSNFRACHDMIDRAKKQMTREGVNQDRLKNAIKNLLQVLDMSYTNVLTSPAYRRELYIASLMHIISNEIGVSFGGCMSAKDREAIKMLHVAAMFGDDDVELPSYTDKPDSDSRKSFVSTMTDLYACGHQQSLTETNASGVKALKTPEMYLPYDVSNELNTRYDTHHDKHHLQDEDTLASANESHKVIRTKSKAKPDSSIARRKRYLDAAPQEHQITELSELYDLLIADSRAGNFKTSLGGGRRFEDGGPKVPAQVYKTIKFLESCIAKGKTLHECTSQLHRIAEDFNRKAHDFHLLRQSNACKEYQNMADLLQGISADQPSASPANIIPCGA